MLPGSIFHRFIPRGPALPNPAVHAENNGKVERYNRILAEELLYSREYTSETQRRTTIEIWRFTTIITDRIQHAEDDRPQLTAGTELPTSMPHTASGLAILRRRSAYSLRLL